MGGLGFLGGVRGVRCGGVVVWLGVCAALVFAMILLGGAVRLTEAGLSMVDWRPIMGVVPPITHAEWLRVFADYQQFPEFETQGEGFGLAEFKFIFWMEYAHRVLGRVIGVAFLLPFLFFLSRWARWRMPRGVVWRLWGLFLLGGFQGVLGWYMVQSGLADVPSVSHYRLAAHSLVAVFIYVYMVRMMVGIWLGEVREIREAVEVGDAAVDGEGRLGLGVLALLVVMFSSGVLVAATDAGQIYNTWPKMGGEWVPSFLFAMQPFWRNFLDNLITMQFVHRWLAVGVVGMVGWFGVRLIFAGRGNGAGGSGEGRVLWGLGVALVVVVVGQFLIGIVALVTRVPVGLGLVHQGGAMVLLTLVVVAVSMRLPRFSAAA